MFPLMFPLKQFCSDETSKWLRLHSGCVVTIMQVAKLHSEAFTKAETEANVGFSHWTQTFFQFGCSNRLKPQTDRLHKSLLLNQNLWLWEMVVMMLILPHKRIQGCPDSLLVKSRNVRHSAKQA
jgi:hypothetical protein